MIEEKPITPITLPLPSATTSPKAEKITKELSPFMQKAREILVNFIVPISALGLCVVIFLIFFLPSYTGRPALEADIEAAKQLRVVLKAKLDNLQKLSDFASVVKENSDLVDQVLVSEDNVPILMTQIDQIAKNSGFSVKRLSYSPADSASVPEQKVVSELDPATGMPEAASAPSLVKKIAVNIGVTGNFNQLKTFLENVEKAARLLQVQSFRYSASKSESASYLDINIVLYSPYLYVESKAITDDPIQLDITSSAFLDLINKLKTMTFYDTANVKPVEFVEESIVEEPAPEEPVAEAPVAEEPALEEPTL